ncbi:MAG: conserved phage C-terminal domain-containing protein [Desulfobacterales bacterium]
MIAEVVTLKKQSKKEKAEGVLNFLNEKTGRRFRPTPVNLKFITARMDEGYTVEDMRAVVAMKCREWPKGHEMNGFLRPATLFNCEKFNSYAGFLGDDE